MEDKPVYHCGPQWWPEWIRKWLSKDGNNECCKDHDSGYVGAARRVTDERFRWCLMCVAFPNFTHEIKNFLMAAGVTVLGWAFKKPRRWFWEKF